MTTYENPHGCHRLSQKNQSNIKLFYGKKPTLLSEKLSKLENIVLDFVNGGIHDFSSSIIYIDNYYMALIY